MLLLTGSRSGLSSYTSPENSAVAPRAVGFGRGLPCAMIRARLRKFSLYPIRLISTHTTYDRRHACYLPRSPEITGG